MADDGTIDRALTAELSRTGSDPDAIVERALPETPARPPRGIPEALGQIVLVLQGGGALGAYQVGVYQALHEAGIEPDWVVGTSIGAINASLIAGSDPADRLDRLEEFWRRVEHGPLHRPARRHADLRPGGRHMLTRRAGHPGLLPAQSDGLLRAAHAPRAGRRRLLRHGAAARRP